jgi:hypothetical protein
MHAVKTYPSERVKRGLRFATATTRPEILDDRLLAMVEDWSFENLATVTADGRRGLSVTAPLM